MTGSSGFLVDTNVLVYMYDNRDGTKRNQAIAVMRHLRRHRVGSLSVQILGEFFNSVTRRLPEPLPHERAQRSVILLSRSWTVFAITPLTVIEAVRGVQRYQLSYWDALIWATAKLNGVPTVLSTAPRKCLTHSRPPTERPPTSGDASDEPETGHSLVRSGTE